MGGGRREHPGEYQASGASTRDCLYDADNAARFALQEELLDVSLRQTVKRGGALAVIGKPPGWGVLQAVGSGRVE